MPPLPIIANVIACHVKGNLTNGRQWVNGYHVLKPSGMSVATAISTIDPILLALYQTNHGGTGAAMLNHMPTTASLQSINYIALDGSSGTVTISHVVAGAAGGDALPASATLTVTSQTGLRGRDKRGRVFLPPFVEADNDVSGKPVSTLVPQFQIQFNGFLADMTTATVFPVVASYKHSSQALVTDYVVRGVWASRRKRLPRPL